ncbi:DUF1649-domain-containing protein [Xylariomycetidae sp. FL0641]|nr:DUF1649-domain-containing protein [Xylariomycetidae sp. FL0641]
MEPQRPQEFILEAFADPASVRDVVRGILHTIFFHRYFPSVKPASREVLDITLPYVDNAELDTMIEKRAAELAREMDAERTAQAPQQPAQHQRTASLSGGGSGGGGGGGGGAGGRGNISVQFFEKKRRKAWYMRAAYGGEDEVCWECWTVRVTVAEPRTETERAKVRKAMEQTLQATALKIMTCVGAHKDHIPPITTAEANPFPYQIYVNQKGGAGWATRMGISY